MVEVDVSNGLPGVTIVGLTDRAIQEARERVKPAIRNAGFAFPQRRVTVNLAPAELHKEGTGFDLTSRVPDDPHNGRWRERSRLEGRGDRRPSRVAAIHERIGACAG
jgi:hypothetical protein